MKFLSIDTSTKYSTVAIGDEEGLIIGLSHLFEKGRSDGLMILLNQCFKKAKMGIKSIDYFGVGVGPGSFTGLRIGLSTIKGLSYALKKKCLPFSSLDAIAFNKAPYQNKRLCVIVDAKRSNVYCRYYKLDPVKRISKEALVPAATLFKKISGNMSFCGDALNVYRNELFKKGKVFQCLPEPFWYPTPESIFQLTLESFKRGLGVDCFQLSASYFYGKDCQVSRPPL